MKIHSGERAYKCNKSNFVSVQAGNLRTHSKINPRETKSDTEEMWKVEKLILQCVFFPIKLSYFDLLHHLNLYDYNIVCPLPNDTFTLQGSRNCGILAFRIRGSGTDREKGRENVTKSKTDLLH